MPIPAFNNNGLLPPFLGSEVSPDRSPYYTTIFEVAQAFGTTVERRRLISNLIDYRRVLAAGGYTYGLQFVDGSFVEDVERIRGRPPGDIDVFSLLSIPRAYLDDENQWVQTGLPFWVQEIADFRRNKDRFSLDTYALAIEEFPLGELLKGVMYWQSLFSQQKQTNAWKGFVTIYLDPNDDDVATAWIGAANA